MAQITPQEWKVLHSVLPASANERDVKMREKLYEELIVRAGHRPEKRYQKKTARLKGQLTVTDIQKALKDILDKLELSAGCIDQVLSLIEQMFERAQDWVDSVSIVDEDSMEMTQFHGLALCVMHYLFLSKLVLRPGMDVSSIVVDLETFREMLSLLLEPEGFLTTSELDISVFLKWQEDQQAAFDELANGGTSIPFMDLFHTYSFNLVKAFVASDTYENGCRSRTFSLLQAINNTPSLPNMVPGPFRYHCEHDKWAKMLKRLEKPQPWSTTYRDTFPDMMLQEPESLYTPAMQNADSRDAQRRVFPVEQR